MLRTLLTVALLALVLVLERAAYYMVRSLMLLHMVGELAMERVDAFAMYANFSTRMTVLLLLGAALSLALGPRISAVIGAVVCAAAYVALSVATVETLGVAIWLWAIGLGILKPSLFVFAGHEVGHKGEARWAGVFVLFYLMINIGAGGASVVVGALAEAAGFARVCQVAAVALVVAAALMGGLALSGGRPAPARPLQTNVRALAGVLLLFAAVVPTRVAYALSIEHAFGSMQPAAASGSWWLNLLNPVAVILFAAIVVVVLLVVPASQKLVVPLIGIGMVAAAVCVIPFTTESSTAMAATTVLVAPVEVLLFGVMLARASVGIGFRTGAAVVALWFVMPVATNFVSTALPAAYQPTLAITAVVLSVAVGATLIALRSQIQRAFFEPREQALGTNFD